MVKETEMFEKLVFIAFCGIALNAGQKCWGGSPFSGFWKTCSRTWLLKLQCITSSSNMHITTRNNIC